MVKEQFLNVFSTENHLQITRWTVASQC